MMTSWPHFPRTEQFDDELARYLDDHEDEIRDDIDTGIRDERGRLIPMEDDQ